MKPSVFTKIINGELPGHKIYEDDRTYALLDINPVQPGQMLVVTRQQVDRITDLEDEDYEALMRTVRILMRHMHDELQPERVCMVVEGFEVPHVHVKLIPCNTASDMVSRPYEASSTELAEMHQRLMY